MNITRLQYVNLAIRNSKVKMTKKSELKEIKLDLLDTIELNPNEMSTSMMDHLKKTIQARGFMQPITVTPSEKDAGKYIVIDGAHRLQAFKELGNLSIPCWVVPDKTDFDIKVDLVNLNRIKGEFDQEKYNKLLESLVTDDEIDNVKDLLNLERSELKNFENFINDKNKIDLDPETIKVSSYERAKAKCSIKKDDIFVLGEHRLMCGDSTKSEDVAILMQEDKCTLMVTNPPNENLLDWSKAYKLFNGNIMYVWHVGENISEVQKSIEVCDFEIVSQIIWVKPNFRLSRGNYLWKHEPCWYAVRKGCKHNWQERRNETTVWDIDEEDKIKEHVTQKPIRCMSIPITNNTKPSDIVYDCFGGTGTTLISCEQLNRKCLIMELDPVYCQIIIERWEEYTGKKADKL